MLGPMRSLHALSPAAGWGGGGIGGNFIFRDLSLPVSQGDPPRGITPLPPSGQLGDHPQGTQTFGGGEWCCILHGNLPGLSYENPVLHRRGSASRAGQHWRSADNYDQDAKDLG